MKTQNEKILRDIEKIQEISQKYNLSNQKEVDILYKNLKKQNQYGFSSWIGNAFYHALRSKTTYAKRRKQVSFLIGQIGIMAIILASLCGGIGVAYKIDEYKNKAKQRILSEVKDEKNVLSEDIDNENAGMQMETEQEVKALTEYQSFYELNSDFAGWLTVPGTEIDCPVLQNKENPEFYLSHNFFKEETRSGSVFLDGNTQTFPQDDNIVLYGHNMTNGEVFGNLKKYKDFSFYQEHKVFKFDTRYEKAVYQIVAVVVTDISAESDFYYYDFYNYDETEFQKCAEFIEENQLYETGYAIDYGDSLVMLSTCEELRKIKDW